MKDLIQINKFSHLHNGKDIFFCKTDFLKNDFDEISKLDNDVVLISGNSDYCITNDVTMHLPKQVKKWFCQNKCCYHPVLEPLPIGVENSFDSIRPNHGVGYEKSIERVDLLNSNKFDNIIPEKLIYANFRKETNLNHRSAVRDFCLANSHITFQEPNLTYENFVEDIKSHKAVLCPQGNGSGDNHRLWETLYCGRVAFTFNRFIYEDLYKDLPVVFVENIYLLEDEEWIEDSINKVKDNKMEKASCNYWLNKIAGSI